METKEQILSYLDSIKRGLQSSKDATNIEQEVISAIDACSKIAEVSLTEMSTAITYDELKELRDNGKLIAGMQYHITDYNTTTVQENTQSAYHQFDIIVTADDEKTLNENARAIKHGPELQTAEFDLIASVEGEEPMICHYTYNSRRASADGTIANGYTSEDMSDIYIKGPVYGELSQLYIDQGSDTEPVLVNFEAFVKYQEPDTNWSVSNVVNTVQENDYFDNSDLQSWDIKYSLDNNIDKFAWAATKDLDNFKLVDLQAGEIGIFTRDTANNKTIDGIEYHAWTLSSGENNTVYTDVEIPAFFTNVYTIDEQGAHKQETQVVLENYIYRGKGVIYYMKDEWNNECPYDFKNIQFLRKLTDGEYNPDSGTDTWVYTFNAYDVNGGGIYDLSTVVGLGFHNEEGGECTCCNNVIKECNDSIGEDGSMTESYYGIHRILNDNVFLNVISNYASRYSDDWYYCSSNILGDNCASNTFGDNCVSNTFANDCRANVFGRGFSKNSFGQACSSNTFGKSCSYNILADICYSNTFGEDCNYNVFGCWCFRNAFGDSCSHKHLEYTSSKTSGITGDTPEFWFNGEKKW